MLRGFFVFAFCFGFRFVVEFIGGRMLTKFRYFFIGIALRGFLFGTHWGNFYWFVTFFMGLHNPNINKSVDYGLNSH